jgi:putative membrane protein
VFYLERELQETQTRAATAEKRVAELSQPVSGQPRATLPAPVGNAVPQAPTVP